MNGEVAIREKVGNRYKHYPEYKDSGIEWLGEIPENWEVNKFNRVSYMKGRIGWQGLKQAEFTMDLKQPYLITGMNFKEGKIRWEEVYHISQERYDEAPEIQLQAQDILMTKDGTIGKLLFVDELPGKASLNSHLLVIRSLGGNYWPKYLYYQMQSTVFSHFVELHKTGTTFFGISQEAVENYRIFLPSMSEQINIAQYLDSMTEKIDSLIEKKERFIELLQEKRTALITHAVTKGLDPDVPMKDSGIEWLGEIPEHWIIVKVKNGFEVQLGKMLQPEPKYKDDILVNYLKALHVCWEKVVFNVLPQMWSSRKDLKTYDVLQGDLLICEGGEGGRSGFLGEIDYPAIIQNSVHRVRPKQGYDTKYLLYLMKTVSSTGWFEVICNKATIVHFTREKLQNLEIPCPPLTEQQYIGQMLDLKTKEIDDFITKTENSVQLLKEYRTALITAAVTGKIDLREEVVL